MFDEAFLQERMKKQAAWKAKGVKTGSGNAFGDVVDVSRRSPKSSDLFPSTAFDTPIASSPVVIQTDGCPSWLTAIINSDSEIQHALSQKKFKPESAHKIALVALAKKPDLYSRNAEHYIQVRLFYMVERHFPDLYRAMKAVPNGGLRSKTTAGKMKAEGQKAGSPDIDIDYPRGAYHGMKLEVKTEKGKLQLNQADAIDYFNKLGYFTVCGKGFDECYQMIKEYWQLPVFDNKTKINS